MGSWRIGSLFGIGLFVHWSFLLLIGYLVYVHVSAGDSVSATIQGILLVLAIFGCVVLHELGHALAARRFGIPTRDITLLPIGGVARLERMPSDPIQELLVALAGPAVNMAIVLAILPLIFVRIELLAEPTQVFMEGSFLLQLAAANLFLIVFNMVPAFPMDGGRVLRAILASMMDYVRATEIAAALGRAMAVVFGIVGLFGIPGLIGPNPFLALIGLMVYFGARQEVHAARLRSLLRGVPVRSAMMTRFYTLSSDEPLGPLLQPLMLTLQPVFPVRDGERVVGALTQADIHAALAAGFEGRVGDRMRASAPPVPDTTPLEHVVQQFQSDGVAMVPVERDGRLVGIVTPETVRQWMAHEASARQSRPGRPVHDATFVPTAPREADSRQ